MKKIVIALAIAAAISGLFVTNQAQAQRDCSAIQNCDDRCRCYHRRCYDGCENERNLLNKAACQSKCDGWASSCHNRC